MAQYGYPALYALFVWWFSTGLIILLDNLPARTFRWSMAAGTVPPHLGYLRSFIRRKPMNLLMPFSVIGGTVVATILVQRAMAPGVGEVQAAGLSFLITMLILAVVEHWVLVLPLPFEKLWSWVLRWRRPAMGRGPFGRPMRRPAAASSRAKPV